MSEFYNKYRRLFTEPDHLHKNQTALAALDSPYKTPTVLPANRYLQVAPQKEPIFKKSQKLGRSPALDEFENYILPRLKTNPDASDRKGVGSMQSPLSSPYLRLPSISFESKPRNFTQLKREEPFSPIAAPKLLEYQQGFMNNRNKINIPQSVPGPRLNLLPIQQCLQNPPKVEKAPQSIIYSRKQRNFSYHDPQQPRESPEGGKKSHRQKSSFESQLYGINQNPYAFANSKLSDIKLIQRYYPKGILNQYKACLFRRHQKKSELRVRRERLRQLLQQDPC